jgi:UDP-N-acetyl-2-amino-2-deoxyglucuronate dehydrogenase
LKKFALIGAAGFIAPRHMKAIKETGNDLVAALDTFDSVGIIDSYFPKADFFIEFERFDRHIDKLRRKGNPIDYVSICSPNYLHDAHIRFGLRSGSDVICEKPLVLNPWNVDALKQIESESDNNIFTILQLRLHKSIIDLKNRIDADTSGKIHDLDLTYITSRGHWYYTSWKGDSNKAGGVATNIGIHFFDMLMWIFGDVKRNVVHLMEHDRASGYIELEKANVRWFLSINADTLPKEAVETGKKTYRLLSIDGDSFEFSDGFTDLHTDSYKHILGGGGFGLDEAGKSIRVVHSIRNMEISGLTGEYHPFAKLAKAKHPFIDR